MPKRVKSGDRIIPCSIGLSGNAWDDIDLTIKTDYDGDINVSEFFRIIYEDYKRKRISEGMTISDYIKSLQGMRGFIRINTSKDGINNVAKLKPLLVERLQQCDYALKQVNNPEGLAKTEVKGNKIREAMEADKKHRELANKKEDEEQTQNEEKEEEKEENVTEPEEEVMTE